MSNSDGELCSIDQLLQLLLQQAIFHAFGWFMTLGTASIHRDKSKV